MLISIVITQYVPGSKRDKGHNFCLHFNYKNRAQYRAYLLIILIQYNMGEGYAKYLALRK